MGLSYAYNSPVSDDEGISIIKHAFDSGITFFDTSDVYGPHTNEILVGKVSSTLQFHTGDLDLEFVTASLVQ
jgi:aryl-alcohol dehydrogenase-like predicted oxidoreductase